MKKRAISLIRIEHINGYGLFSEDENKQVKLYESIYHKQIMERHSRFPTPFMDIKEFTKNHYCAFRNLNRFKDWFNKFELEDLYKVGFRVYSIKVKDYLSGNYQYGFKKEDIISKNEINLLTL